MRRLLMTLSLVALMLASQQGRSQKQNNIKDYMAAVDAIKSKSPFDRASGLSFMALLGEEAKGSSRDVVGLLFDGDAEVRKWAKLAIPKVNPTLAGPVLTLAQNPDPERRLEALQQLAKLGATAAPAIPAVLVFLQQAPAGDRPKVVEALISVGTKDPNMGAVLANMALGDPDPKVRTTALAGLQKMENPKSALEVFATRLNDADPAQRAAAVRGLGSMGGKNTQAVQLIRNALNDASPTVRNAAKQALEQPMKK